MILSAIRVPLPFEGAEWVAIVLSICLSVGWYMIRRAMRKVLQSHEQRSVQSWAEVPAAQTPKVFGKAAERERLQNAEQSLPLLAKLILVLGRAQDLKDEQEWGALEERVTKLFDGRVPDDEIESLSNLVQRDKRGWKALAKAFSLPVSLAKFRPSELMRYIGPISSWPGASAGYSAAFLSLVRAELGLSE